MTDWIGLGVIVVLIVLALFAMSRLGQPRREMSVEEFEERARTGGHTRAGMFGLQEILDPKQAKAVAVQKDLKHGYYNKKRVPGDGDDADDAGGTGGILRPGPTNRPAAGSSGPGAGGVDAELSESEERDA